MSIDRNVGAVARHLAQQRLKPQYLSFKQGYRRFMWATWLGRQVYRMTHGVKKALKQSLLPVSYTHLSAPHAVADAKLDVFTAGLAFRLIQCRILVNDAITYSHGI